MADGDVWVSGDTIGVVRANTKTNAVGTVPASPIAGQVWIDTANNLLKYRNAANNAWITAGISGANPFDQSLNTTDAPTFGQLRLPVQGTTGGLLIGGDSTFYRLTTTHLATRGHLSTVGVGTQVWAGYGSDYIRMVEGGILESITSLTFKTNGNPPTVTGMTISTAGQVAIPITGTSGGLLIGGDVLLYRSAANVLKTDDAFYAVGNISTDNNLIIAATANYPIYLERQDEAADGFIMQNCHYNSGYYTASLLTKWDTSHANFGSRGIIFK